MKVDLSKYTTFSCIGLQRDKGSVFFQKYNDYRNIYSKGEVEEISDSIWLSWAVAGQQIQAWAKKAN